MIIVLKNDILPEQYANIVKTVESYGFKTFTHEGKNKKIVGAVGDITNFDPRKIKVLDGVWDVFKATEPYKLVSRNTKNEKTIIRLGNEQIGADKLTLISGPCSVESEAHIFRMAKIVKEAGIKILRGGAFKPRSSPYSFQGLGEEGLKYLRAAADEYGLYVITEVLQNDQVALVYKYTDIFQVGARNMQNFSLLKELASTNKPVMIKRGVSATIEELFMSAEYILSGGNENVILCERGIRTFENYTRHTFDLSSIPVMFDKTHLPVIADPSHSAGLRNYVPALARAAVAVGADGLMLEIHDNPKAAFSDGPQALYPEDLSKLLSELKIIAGAVGKTI